MAKRTERTTTTPRDWHIAGTHRSAYVAGVDPGVTRSGKAAGYLAAKRRKMASGFGTLMQSVAPARYGGKRIRLSCHLKSEKVDGWAGLWMRVDAPGRSEHPLAFDNMENRPIKGTADWTACEVVLDVDPAAVNISFGVLLAGPGIVWIDGMRFEEVDHSVPVTSRATSLNEPQNLGFDE